MKIILLGFCVFILQFISGNANAFVEEVFKWKKVEYDHFPVSENTYVGPYKYSIPENENIVSMGYHPASGLMIVAFLRRRPGVPTTLGAFCASEYSHGSSPRIWRFPNYHVNEFRATDFEYFTDIYGRKQWNPLNKYAYNQFNSAFNTGYNNYQWNLQPYRFKKDVSHITTGLPLEVQRIVAVYHITIDERCNRVFFVDNGQVTYNHNTTYIIQKPALVVVGLPTNGCHLRNFPTLRRVEIPDRITARGADGFMHVTLDYQPGDSCDDLFLYITNTFHNYLTVYDYKKNDFWSFEHETFNPIAAESHFVFDKSFTYQLNMGILSVALGYPDQYGDRVAYYTPVAGIAQYAVSTKVLKDKSKSDFYYTPSDFAIMGYRGCNHQSLKTVIDYTYGVMFYSETQSNQIRCWNISQPLNPDNIGVVYESEELTFGAQMFIDSLGFLWFHSTQIPVVYSSDVPLNLDQVNTKLFRVRVSDAIRGTVCANGHQYIF
ncbi:L-dopachrome tautomerase yellow-f2-like [Lutzomyia longipalpis]|uniref:L-dopachrome tautomerase yellow-f2-like n=1 Tax=Lutzomyia longipalpis TaxID=7200 RepID=UPI0024842065|nr:L-dopachrome tautomerase yellow-f2-like [Lutzomyia longipalpis]